MITHVHDADIHHGDEEDGYTCIYHSYAAGVKYHSDYSDGSKSDVAVSARSSVKLLTGGKALIGRKNLIQINVYQPWTVSYGRPADFQWWLPESSQLDPTTLTILGKHPDTNGNLYVILPDNTMQDVTVTAPAKHYTVSITPTKYKSYFEIFVKQGNPGGVAPWGSNDVGHAWWRLSTDAPIEGLQAMGVGQGQNFAWTNQYQDIFQTNMTCFLNQYAGFYPDGNYLGVGFSWTNLIQFVPGKLQCPDPDGIEGNFQIKRMFYIGFPDLVKGLNYTKGMYLQPPTYSVLGYACVSAAVDAGQASGVKLPSPYFLTPWVPQTFGLLNWTPDYYAWKLWWAYRGDWLDDPIRDSN